MIVDKYFSCSNSLYIINTSYLLSSYRVLILVDKVLASTTLLSVRFKTLRLQTDGQIGTKGRITAAYTL